MSFSRIWSMLCKLALETVVPHNSTGSIQATGVILERPTRHSTLSNFDFALGCGNL